ncbi:MAG: hypothetical protein UHD05_01085 [Ruminococcus sp.]|nr:hypothetical protein [Ruminococcus sp.]
MNKLLKVIAATLVLCTAALGFTGCNVSLKLKSNSDAEVSDSSVVI